MPTNGNLCFRYVFAFANQVFVDSCEQEQSDVTNAGVMGEYKR